MEETSPLIGTSDYKDDTNHMKLYKKRWLILTIFSLNAMMSQALWFSLSSINNIATKYYEVNPSTIDWLANSFVLGIVIFSLPWAYFTRSWGLRPTLIAASSFTAIGCALHYAGSNRNRFYLYLIGQLFAGVPQGPLYQVIPDLSATWFGVQERAFATCIVMALQFLGSGIGFLQPTYMVPQSDDRRVVEQGMHNMNLAQLCMSVVLLLMVYLFFEERPPAPPSISRVIESETPDMPFTESLKILSRDVQFNLLLQSISICNGTAVCLATFLNQFVVNQYPTGYETYIGWMGFIACTAPFFTTILFGFIVNKYHAFRSVAVGTIFTSMILTVIFFVVLLKTRAFMVIFIDYILLGGFALPFLATGMEQAAELTYPVPEGTTGAVVIMVSFLYAFVMVSALSVVVEEGKVLLTAAILVGFYLLATILAACVKTNLRRLNTEIDALDYQPTVNS